MQRVLPFSAEKPAAHQESLAADCFPGGQTSRRTMTFFVSSDEEKKKERGREGKKKRWWQRELKRLTAGVDEV